MTNYLEILNNMTPEEIQRIAQEANAALAGVKFIPFPGTQTQAYFSEADILLYGGQPGGGKRLDVRQKIPVPLSTDPSGFKEHGQLKIGDEVYGANGRVVKVLAVHPVCEIPDAYEVEFNTGEKIKADAEHLWLTWDNIARERLLRCSPEWREKRRKNRPSRAKAVHINAGAAANVTQMNKDRVYNIIVPKPELRTTLEISKTITRKNAGLNHCIDIADPIQGDEIDLPIDPYWLGLWLGDGTKDRPEIGMSVDDFYAISKFVFYDFSERIETKNRKTPFCVRWFKGKKEVLRKHNLLGNKHIPPKYLRSSYEQRLSLLRGLMDTDGTASEKGYCELSFSDRSLADGALELINSLGIKCTMTVKKIKGYKDHYRLKFLCDVSVFNLPRKKERQKKITRETARRRYITNVGKCDPVPMNCITVEGGLYCVGPTFIVTHNSALINGLAIQEHYRSLLVRRNHSDLRPLIDVAKELVGSEKGFIGGGRPEYNKDDGGVIHYMGLAADGGLGGMQGEAHDLICVGKGTPVLMEGGEYKPIQDITVGDRVMTLEGGKKVLNVFPAMYKDSVEVSTSRGRQIQSISHGVFSPHGWISFSDLCRYNLLPFCNQTEFSFSKQCQSESTFCSLFCKKLPFVLQRLSRQILGMRQVFLKYLIANPLDRKALSAFFACTAQEDQGNDFSVCYGHNQILLRPPLLSWFRTKLFSPRCVLFHASQKIFCSVGSCDVSGGLKMSLPQDFQVSYLVGSRLCDERIRVFSGPCAAPRGGQQYPHQPIGAELSIPIYLHMDDGEGIPKYNRRIQGYEHPYKGGIRQVDLAVHEDFSFWTPVGKKEVYDIHVEDVNHYITAGGFINKNCIDEVAQITEDPVRTLMGWLRRTTRTPRSQRLRMVMASNPPLDSTGDWLVPFYPCWLDETYPNPAADGELRWFIRDGGVDVECKKGDSVLLDGKEVFAHSRTFIASNYTDNPYIDTQEYAAKLANMPEMQRKILMSGNFLLSRGDAEGQMIPTRWIQMAQARWTADGEKGRHMVAMGADVTGGGSNNTAVARLYDELYFGEMIVKPGTEVGSGSKQAALIIENRRGNCPVGIDMGGGYGGGPKEMLSFSGIDAYAFNPSGETGERTKDRAYGFYNQRALAYWRLREALDPDADGGCVIALPPSKKLLSDLATPKFTTVMYGGRMVIKMESKDEIKKRIRRSPDEGDAVVIALFVYMKKGAGDGGGGLFGRKGLPRVNIGHEKRKKRRK